MCSERKYTCRFCGKPFIRACGLKIHEDSCKQNPNRIRRKTVCNFPKEWIHKSKKGGWDCPYCRENFRTRRELARHKHIYHQEAFCAWNKGKTKETDERIKKYSETSKERYRNGVLIAPQAGKSHTEEEKKKISEGMRKAKELGKNIGGYKPHKKGWGKKCKADGVFFDSSWEVAYWFYCKDHGIHLERNKKRFSYEYKGESHSYLPDFFDGTKYIEIKGHEDERCKFKYSAVENLVVVYDVSKEVSYMKDKYGKNWLDVVCEDVYNKTEKPKLDNEKRETAKMMNKIDSIGRINWRIIDESCWEDRKKKIMEAINGGIDATQPGWKTKVLRATGLTKRVLYNTIDHFKEDFKSYN